MIENPAWMTRAACRNTDPDLWHNPDDKGGRSLEREAKTICRGCPVLGHCGTWIHRIEATSALTRTHGTYAGLSKTERYALRRTIRGMTPEQYVDFIDALMTDTGYRPTTITAAGG